MRFKTYLVPALGVLSISFAAIFIRFCDDVPAIMIAAIRMGVAASLLHLYCPLRGRTCGGLSRRDLLLTLLGGFFLACHFSLWISSLKFTSVASSVVLVTTNPIFVGLFSYLLFKERQGRALVGGIVLSLIGSVVLALGEAGGGAVGSNPLLGDLLALGGAVMASAYLMTGSRLRGRMDLLTQVVWVYTFATLFLLGAVVVMGIPFTGYRGSSYLFMVLLAIVPQIIGHTAINWALKHLKTAMVAVMILGEPVGASILAYIFFSEGVRTLQLIGMVIILSAILLASRSGRKDQRNFSPDQVQQEREGGRDDPSVVS